MDSLVLFRRLALPFHIFCVSFHLFVAAIRVLPALMLFTLDQSGNT
jgi:hypothetical protein